MVSPVVPSPPAASGSATIAPDHQKESSKGTEVSIRLWPPGPRTRSHVADRMADNLKSLSGFYQGLAPEEAVRMASLVEEQAFEDGQEEDLAASRASGDKNNGSSAVRVYAKQASRLMLQVLKTGKLPEKVKKGGEHEKEVSSVTTAAPETSDVKSATPDDLFDISGGERLVLELETAEKVFSPLADPACSVTKIRLSNWSFTKDAAKHAGEVLIKINEKLVSADLSDIVAGRSEAEALEVMSILSDALKGAPLRYLNLSNNALGEKGVRAFSSLLQSQKHLNELHFENNGISADAANAILELVDGSELKVLHFHNNMTGDTGTEKLTQLVRQAPALEDLRLSSSRVGTRGVIALSSAVQELSSLKKLDLRDNNFEPTAASNLAAALSHKPVLQELYLADLGLGDNGVRQILEALREGAPNLSVLDLGNNEITVSGAAHVAKFLEKKPTLKKLGLQENELKDKGVILISKALRQNHDELEELDFTLNEFGSEGAIAAAKAVADKSGFKKLILESNHISAKGLKMVEKILASGVGASVLAPLEDNEDEDTEDEEGGKEETDESEDLENKVDALSI